METTASYNKARFDKGKATIVSYVLLKNEETHQTKLDAKFRGPFLMVEVLDGGRYNIC